jgi:hypothetical protein
MLDHVKLTARQNDRNIVNMENKMIHSTFVHNLPFKVTYNIAQQYKDMLNFYNRTNWRIPSPRDMLGIPVQVLTWTDCTVGNRVEVYSKYHIAFIDVTSKANVILVRE